MPKISKNKYQSIDKLNIIDSFLQYLLKVILSQTRIRHLSRVYISLTKQVSSTK